MAFAESTVTIGLRWRDMDMLGHLNQAVYHELLEEGRSDLMTTAGAHTAFVLARVELDHLREVRRDHEEVVVVSRVTELGRKKIVVDSEIARAGEVAARSTAVLVCWDPVARTSRELTDAERTALGGGDTG